MSIFKRDPNKIIHKVLDQFAKLNMFEMSRCLTIQMMVLEKEQFQYKEFENVVCKMSQDYDKKEEESYGH